MYSALEITEKEFLIKLDRSKFNINLIRTLLNIVEVSNPQDIEEQGLPSQSFAEVNKRSSGSEPEYFSSLDDK